MNQASIAAAAAALRAARAQRQPIAPVSTTYGIEGLEAAYAVSDLNIQADLAAGRRIVGLKVGLTSKAVQQQLGVDQPDFGVLLDDMEFLNGQDVPTQRLMQPKVEAEVAFVVGRDLVGDVPSYAEFVSAIDHALQALEIVDSAITDWKISLVDTVADNASCGVFVVGPQRTDPLSLDLAQVSMHMWKNGTPAGQGLGSAVQGHPAEAVAWLANTLGAFGIPFKAGELILSGSLAPLVPAQAGDRFHMTIEGLGECSVAFTE